jgi:hypothetical protein
VPVVEVPVRYEGPPGTANGGWVAGLLAEPFGDAATVRLEAAVPLASALRFEVDGDESTLWDGDRRLAVGRPAEGPAAPVDPVAAEVAASTVGPTAEEHAFPNCFVCGPTSPGGLHLTAGPVDGSTVATVFVPDPSTAGLDEQRLAWCALDCPSGLAAMRDGVACVLGTMTARVARPLVAGERLVVVGRHLRTDGRKRFAATALYDDDGRAVAWSETVWIALSGA